MYDRSDLYLIEQDSQQCDHPESERYPYVGDRESCGLCGAIVNKNWHVMTDEELYDFVLAVH